MRALYDIELVKMLAPNQHQDSPGESRIDKVRKFLSSPLTKKKPSVLQLKTFGTPIDTLLQRMPADNSVPYIITRLCQYIHRTGLTHEGLFRISGNARSVERLRASFDRSGDAPLETEGDVPSAAALLKLFLRELPDPIIPMTMHCEFLNAVKDKDKRASISCLAELVEKLPPVNYCILNYLSSFLKQVSDMEDQNRMSASSLGIVFGPNLFRVTDDFVGLKEQSLTNQIVTYFITDYQEIFKEENINFTHSTCFSSAPIDSTNHQVAAMVASWPETKGTTTMLSTWSLGPLSVQIHSSDDSCLPLASLSHSIGTLEDNSFISCKFEEPNSAAERHIQLSSKDVTSEYSIHRRENLAFENNIVEDSLLASESSLSLDGQSRLKDYYIGEEEPVLSNSVLKTIPDISISCPTNLGADFHACNDKKEIFDMDNKIGTQKDYKYTEDPCSKVSEHQPKMSNEKTEEMLKDVHRSYPRGRRRHVRHHKGREFAGERRSRSELRTSNRHFDDEGDCNGNSSSTLSQSSKTDLLYSSTGSLEESTSEIRHSWPAFRKNKEDDIALSPLPQQLGMTHCAEASVSPSAFRTYLSHRNLHLDPNLPPSPPVEQEDLIVGGGIEASTTSGKQLSRKVHDLKKKIKKFEENFEKMYGYRPSHAEKCNNIAVKKMLTEFNSAKLELKHMKEDPLLWSAEDAFQNKSSKGTNTRSSQGLFSLSSGTAASMSIEDSVKEAMEYLSRQRKEGKRSEILEEMNKEQLVAEKVAIQKVLLNFESMHGRPASKNHREVVRPLYDRYRCTKRLIARFTSGKDPAELQPILEHEAMDFKASNQTTNLNDGPETRLKAEGGNQNGEKDSTKMVAPEHINFHELSVTELADELNLVRDEKRRLRKLLRDFEEKFKKEHGRKAQREDKHVMESYYTEYKTTKAKLKLLEALVAKHEQTS